MRNSDYQSKLKRLIYQVFKFCMVGGICSLIDYVCLYVLAHIFNYLTAAAISYIISTVINYVLSMRYVFVSKNDSKTKEMTIFMVLSLIGLVATELCMYVFTDIFKCHYMISKIFSIAIVMIFNFVTRKIFLEKKDG